MRFIRWALGRIILLLDWVFTPKGIKRSPEDQLQVDTLTKGLSLYQYAACPFCVKVRRAMKRSTLNIPTHDANRCDSSRQKLMAGGGKLKVPCLRIETDNGDEQWMYESSDIIAFLQNRLSTNGLSH